MIDLRTRYLALALGGLVAMTSGCALGVALSPSTAAAASNEAAAAAEDEDANAAIAATVPSTDIVMVELAPLLAGRAPTQVRPVVRRRGYDNQPAFTPDGAAILYSSIRDDQQSDVFRYDIATGETRRLTASGQSEYSPTPLGDGGFSCIQVALDGTQRLWRYAQNGEPLFALRADITGVGYHAWLSPDALALFIVDEPLRLEIAAVNGGDRRTVATNIGRALQRTVRGTLAYVQKSATGSATVREVVPASGVERLRAVLPAAGEDLVWLQDGSALVADGRRLWRLPSDGAAFEPLVDLTGSVDGDISRLAVDPANRWLALVVTESEL